MRTLPNMTIIAPSDKLEMINLVKDSILLKSPIYIRIARGGEPDINQEVKKFKIGKGILKIKPGKLLLISTGIMTQEAIKAANIINSKYKKNKIGVLHLGTVKPLDVSILKKWMPKVDKIITLEENYLTGGFGSSILEFCNDNFPEISNKISRIGIKEKFISKYGSHRELMEFNNLTFSSIIKYINKKYP
jgi:transketolase